MKYKNKIIGILAVLLLTLSSCTNEGIDNNQFQLLKKMVEVSVDQSSTETVLNYEGNKILTIDKVNLLVEFFYTGDVITKSIESDKTTNRTTIYQYSYSNGQLTKITSSDNYVVTYIYNNDESVAYVKHTKDSNNNDVIVYHGILYFKNGNLIKDEKFLDGTGKDSISKKSVEIVYDTKKNPLINILGFSKLLNYLELISINNKQKWTETSYVEENNNQVISSITMYRNELEYDTNEYPIGITSENPIFGAKDSKHLKSMLFY